MLKSHTSLCVSFSRTAAGLCIYHLLVWSNWNFLHISQWITLPTQSCLALYSLFANLLHSLSMWLIVLSLSPHSLHLLFCCVLSILALIWFVLMALSCAAIRRDSVSLLRFPFLSQVQVFTEIWVTSSLVCSSGLYSVFWPIPGMLLLLLLLLEFFTPTLSGGFSWKFDSAVQRFNHDTTGNLQIIFSSLRPAHNLNFLFCCVLSIFDLT